MIEDPVNRKNGHREQASIAHPWAHKAAIRGGVLVLWRVAPDPRPDKDTVTGRKLNCNVEDYLAVGRQTKTGCERTDVRPFKS